MPENLSDAVVSLRDLAEVLLLDRLNTKRKPTSVIAGAACRTLRFHSRSRIRTIAWGELFQKLGVPGVEQVILPGPAARVGDIGTADYHYALATVVKALQPETIFEFGTYMGMGALVMAANASASCRIYTMDLPDNATPDSVPELNQTDQSHIANSRTVVGRAFLRSPFKNKITQVRADSMTYRAETCATNVDLVYVDGGHSLPVIAKDTENALRILASKGTIIWDDYYQYYPDVVEYLDDFAARHPVYTLPGTNVVIYSRRWDTATDKG